MHARVRIWLIAATALLGGGLTLCLVRTAGRLREEGALCVLRLQPGVSDITASFTTPRAIGRFHVGVRPGARRERLSVSITGPAGLICRVNTEATHFSCGLDIPADSFTATLKQETGYHGGLVVISDKDPQGRTGWQIWSRSCVGLLVASGVWAMVSRRSRDLRRRVVSVGVFQHLLLAFVLMFAYLLFHEGGHGLAELCFGRYDWATSDFWGIHGTPHAGGKAGPALEPWQQALISGGGPLLPTLAGWALFAVWSSGLGRNLRHRRPLLDLYGCATIGILVFPFVAVGGYLLGMLSDSDWIGFITHVPGPLWLVKAIAWGILVVNGFILWRVLPELHRAWKAHLARLLNKARDVPTG